MRMTNVSIQEFYLDRSVFITGATGFMGKILVEKLLRSCTGINRIYLLIRPKTDQDADTRLQQLINCEVFESLRQNQSEVFEKLIPISGDISLPDLGISSSDMKELIENVSVVFHSAARVKFDDDLRSAVDSNMKGPQRVAIFCRQLKQLKAFVHVSTTYSNLHNKEIAEEIYPSSLDPQKLIDLVDLMDDQLLSSVTKQLIGNSPNAYSFTKALGERLLQNLSDEYYDHHLPVVIVRPSIVVAAMKEPLPGWSDNFNGPNGIVAGVSKGLIQTIRANSEVIADLIPVDIPINLMIAAAWDKGSSAKSSGPIRVYNCSTGTLNPIKWKTFRYLCLRAMDKFPLKDILRCHSAELRSSSFVYQVEIALYHHLPSFIIDYLARLCGRKPFMSRLYTRAHKTMSCLEFFTLREWHFISHNPSQLMGKMSNEEQNTFNFDVRKINWETYIDTYVSGVRKYLFNDDFSSLPAAINNLNKMKRWKLLIHLVVVGLALFFFYALWCNFSTPNTWWRWSESENDTANYTHAPLILSRKSGLKLCLQRHYQSIL